MFSYDFVLYAVLPFVGDYDELSNLRLINKRFAKFINKKFIFRISVQENMSNYELAIKLFNQITTLECSGMDIKTLPKSTSITELYCPINELLVIDIPSLKKLDCSSNDMIKLSNLNELIYLNCSSNGISKIPYLPKLKYLDCGYNNLQTLPDMPKLEHLNGASGHAASARYGLAQRAAFHRSIAAPGL